MDWIGAVRNEIIFVPDNDGRSLLNERKQSAFFLMQQLRGIEHNQHESGIGQGFMAAPDAELLRLLQRLVRAFAQARGVDELDGNAAQPNALRNQVARGAG